jgi:hypothetical protein
MHWRRPSFSFLVTQFEAVKKTKLSFVHSEDDGTAQFDSMVENRA